MARYPLRSVLAGLLFIPALLAGTADGCDCGDGPNLPETNAVGDCANPDRYHSNDQAHRNLADRPAGIARKFEDGDYSVKQIRNAIEKVKSNARFDGNGDVLVDVRTGEVYPRTRGGGIGDSIGNLHEYLPAVW